MKSFFTNSAREFVEFNGLENFHRRMMQRNGVKGRMQIILNEISQQMPAASSLSTYQSYQTCPA